MMKKLTNMFLVLIFTLFYNLNADIVLPNDYQKCNVTSPEFNTCATIAFNKLVNMGVRGIPSLGIKPLDPVFIKYACFHSSGSGPISMEVQLLNATFYGFSNLNIFSTDGTDLKTRNVIQMKGLIPTAKIIANYTMAGSILSIPLNGVGMVEVFLYNFTLDYQAFHCPFKKNNKTYFAVRNITLDSNMQSGKVIYTSDPNSQSLDLTNADINNAINENLMAIYEEYKPTVNQLILSVISPRVVRFNNEVSFEELFVK